LEATSGLSLAPDVLDSIGDVFRPRTMPNCRGRRDLLEFTQRTFLELPAARPAGPPPSLWDPRGDRGYRMCTRVTRCVHPCSNKLETLRMGREEWPVPKPALLISRLANREPNVLPNYCVVAFMWNLLRANAAEEIGAILHLSKLVSAALRLSLRTRQSTTIRAYLEHVQRAETEFSPGRGDWTC